MLGDKQIQITANAAVTEATPDFEDEEIVKKLVGKSDFLLENFRAGTMEKWGMDYETLSSINRRLIMIRVSGYGQTGPYSNRAGYGGIGEAMGGIRYLAGDPDRRPASRARAERSAHLPRVADSTSLPRSSALLRRAERAVERRMRLGALDVLKLYVMFGLLVASMIALTVSALWVDKKQKW